MDGIHNITNIMHNEAELNNEILFGGRKERVSTL
jgi:hypothetical protein